MNNDRYYSSLKDSFESLNKSLINEGIDSIVAKCFSQVKENINYLNSSSFEESVNSINNKSSYVNRNFKIKETQQIFKYCILLLEKENGINPHHKLLLENLLLHFQRIFSSEVNGDLYDLDHRPEKYRESSSSSYPSFLPFLSTEYYSPLPNCDELDKQLLFEQNKELIKLKESVNELLNIQNILLNEIACDKIKVDTIQEKINKSSINTDKSHLLYEINVTTERHRRGRIFKLIFTLIASLFSIFLLFRIFVG
ncbi:hypothetical protein HWI79_3421 [Cryptosporidium felis]|nr:hypothetical protein HWI79_3421 [Cryptosporidium felis]